MAAQDRMPPPHRRQQACVPVRELMGTGARRLTRERCVRTAATQHCRTSCVPDRQCACTAGWCSGQTTQRRGRWRARTTSDRTSCSSTGALPAACCDARFMRLRGWCKERQGSCKSPCYMAGAIGQKKVTWRLRKPHAMSCAPAIMLDDCAWAWPGVSWRRASSRWWWSALRRAAKQYKPQAFALLLATS